MLIVSNKIQLTVIAEDFPVEVDWGVAEHNTLLQCPGPQECSIVNVQKRKMGQVIFSHRCTLVVIQSLQCACAQCDWNCAKMDVGFQA